MAREEKKPIGGVAIRLLYDKTSGDEEEKI
jgi:hypothetical protein